MAAAKQLAREVLDAVPDDASFEDIHYHLYVRQKVEKALEQERQGRTLSQEEVGRRMARWLEE